MSFTDAFGYLLLFANRFVAHRVLLFLLFYFHKNPRRQSRQGSIILTGQMRKQRPGRSQWWALVLTPAQDGFGFDLHGVISKPQLGMGVLTYSQSCVSVSIYVWGTLGCSGLWESAGLGKFGYTGCVGTDDLKCWFQRKSGRNEGRY